MAKAVLMVLTNPASPDREDDYNDWYDNVHVPDVVAVDGFVAATRYRVADVQMSPDAEVPAHRYLAVYEIEADDLSVAMKNLGDAVGGGGMVISDALDMASPPAAVLYEEITPRRAAR